MLEYSHDFATLCDLKVLEAKIFCIPRNPSDQGPADRARTLRVVLHLVVRSDLQPLDLPGAIAAPPMQPAIELDTCVQ